MNYGVVYSLDEIDLFFGSFLMESNKNLVRNFVENP